MTNARRTSGLRWWHVLPAGLACAACCALPVLATAGIVGGGTAVALGQWIPAAAIALVVASLLVFALRARRRPTRDAAAGADPGSDQARPSMSARGRQVRP